MRSFPALLVLAVLVAVGTSSAQQLQCQPCWYVFPKTQVGQSTSYSFQLVNIGTKDLQITSVTSPGNGFALETVQLPATIQPGQSMTLPVIFSPNAVAYDIASFTITSNDSRSPRIAQIAGAGISNGGGGSSPARLLLSPPVLNFGNVAVGGSTNLHASLTAWNGPVTISSASTSASQFTITGMTFPLTIPAGQTVQATIQFKPNAAGTTSAQDQFVSNASNPTASEQLAGTGVSNGGGSSTQLSVSPSTLNFGNVPVGSTASLPATLTASNGSVIISSDLTNNSQFAIAGLALPFTLQAGQSVQATIQFKPTAAGLTSAQDQFVSNASNSPALEQLSGTGVSTGGGGSTQLSVSPSTLNFGNVNVGSTASLQATLTASSGSVTISTSETSSSEFTIAGLSLPITLQAGQSVQATIQFTPNASGAASAQDQFISNATNSPAREQLTGTGVAQASHSASLTWQAGATGVVGYNIFRGTANGGPYSQLNSSTVTTTSYTDSTVVGGNIYYYVTTEINNTGQQSGYSNVAEAQIPN